MKLSDRPRIVGFFRKQRTAIRKSPQRVFPNSHTELTGMNLRGTPRFHGLACLLLMDSAVTKTSEEKMKWKQFFKKVRFVKLVCATVPILAVIVFGSVLLQSSEANSQPGVQAAPCTLATLTGSYGTTVSFVAEDGVGAAIGRWAFDGAGMFLDPSISMAFLDAAGEPLRGPIKFSPTAQVHYRLTLATFTW